MRVAAFLQNHVFSREHEFQYLSLTWRHSSSVLQSLCVSESFHKISRLITLRTPRSAACSISFESVICCLWCRLQDCVILKRGHVKPNEQQVLNVQVSAIAALSPYGFSSAASRLNKPEINTGWKGLPPAARQRRLTVRQLHWNTIKYNFGTEIL